MSSNYKFVDNPDFELPSLKYEPMKTYGFKRVTKAEMESILERLQRKTYNAELYFGERFQRIPSPPRPPSTVCRRLGENHRKETHEVRHLEVLGHKELDRLVRRLCTPTASTLADSESNGKREHSALQRGNRCFSREADNSEREKEFIKRISRPTTATRDKGVLRYASDPVVVSYNQDNARKNDGERPLSRQEQSDLVRRIQLDTVASRGGKLPFCKRMPSTWKRSLAATEISA